MNWRVITARSLTLLFGIAAVPAIRAQNPPATPPSATAQPATTPQTAPPATPPQSVPPGVNPQTTAPPTTAPTPAVPEPTQTFAAWLADLRIEALAKGITDATFDKAFVDVAPDPVVIARDRMQPEQTQSLDQYLAARLTPKNIASAQAALTDQKDLLERVRSAYGIPPTIMVSIWGIESGFGQFLGTRPVIASLATLAYDARRPALFRSELIEALRILDKGLVALPDLKGSWAGAMGQPQFMPSSYLRHAVDFDGDGKADIWTSKADVLASMANYLKKAGWIEGERWGREVSVTPEVLARIEKTVPLRSSGCAARKQMTELRPLAAWSELGVTMPDGSKLPTAAIHASLVRGVHRYFLAYHNYEAILDYNCSNSYAVSVGVMSDTIK